MLSEIKQVLTPEEIARVKQLASAAAWVDGSNSAGERARDHKSNREIDRNDPNWKSINEIVVAALYQHPQFQSDCLPARVSACFISRFEPGMAFGSHIDDPVMGPPGQQYRSDIAITIYLSAPEDYAGGELVVQTHFGEQSVKLAAGNAVAYPASSLHRVNTVSQGERLVCVLWVQSFVKDPSQRELLAELANAREALLRSLPAAQVTTSVDRVYNNLVRMWTVV